MSWEMIDCDGKEIYTNLLPVGLAIIIGDKEVPLKEFANMASHWLGGGAFGWGEGTPTPTAINEALDYLFRLYQKQEDGSWKRVT